MRGQMQGEAKGQRAPSVRATPAGSLPAVGQQQHEQRADERGDEDLREDDVVHTSWSSGPPIPCGCRLRRRHEAHAYDCEEEHGCGACGQPAGVGAQIAGLPAAEELAEQGGDAGEQPCGAADDDAFAEPAEDVAGGESERLDDGVACRSRQSNICAQGGL